MLNSTDYLTRPAFADRCRAVRAELEAGSPMSLGEIADRLGLPFEVFVGHLSAEIFRQERTIGGVVIFEATKEPLQ